MKFRLTSALLIVVVSFTINFAQSDTTITVASGAEYQAGSLYRLLLGDGWRDVWTQTFQAEYLDLNMFDGGLTPTRVGGGMQTKSLRFMSKNGIEWKFRSINKDPIKSLPQELKEGLVADIYQDLNSTSHPLGSLVVAPLLQATNILQAIPQLFVMPDDPKLGEFREEFAGMLGTIEVHPDEGKGDTPGFEGSEKIKGTFKLYETLAEKRSEKADAIAFLKARLMDCYINDWDRHADQWRWAKFEEDGQEWWRPIPRDRDRAFSKYNGLIPYLAAYVVLQWNTFSEDYPDAKLMTWSGRHMDRRFLSEITKTEWDSVTSFLVNTLTDELIDESVKKLPPEIYQLCGKELIAKLKSRRDNLPEFSDEFYNLVNEVVFIYASDDEDYVEINRLNNNETEVIIHRRDMDNGGKRGDVLYHKVFDNELTSEFRIFLNDDDDYAVLRGEVDDAPLVRVIGGDGADALVDSSIVNGYFLSVTPIPSAETKTRFYDSGKKSVFTEGASTSIDTDEEPEPETDLEKYEPLQISVGREIWMIPSIGYSSDDGLVVGISPLIFGYNFRSKPYQYSIYMPMKYYSAFQEFDFLFEGSFKSMMKNTTVDFLIEGNSHGFNRFFGMGNETGYNSEWDDHDRYDLKHERLTFLSSIEFHATESIGLEFGAQYARMETEPSDPILYNSLLDDDYGTDTLDIVNFFSAFKYDTRDNKFNAHSGLYLNLRGEYYPKLMDIEEFFAKASLDARFFHTFHALTDITIALRAGGEKIWGKYPFTHSAFLGWKRNLRGYKRERFAGDASIFGQAEMRMFLTKMFLLIIADVGVHGFIESGRVFYEGESSSLWHASYGGGFWVSYLNRLATIVTTFGISEESMNTLVELEFNF